MTKRSHPTIRVEAGQQQSIWTPSGQVSVVTHMDGTTTIYVSGNGLITADGPHTNNSCGHQGITLKMLHERDKVVAASALKPA